MGVPFSDVTPSRRGFLFEDIAREYDESSSGCETRNAEEGLNVKGRRRCGRNTVYDWIRISGGRPRRVELKSAQFTWDKALERWLLMFYGLKMGEFDDLVLAVYAPWGLDLWEYKGHVRTGLCNVKHTKGARIQFYGKHKVVDVLDAWQSGILPKLSQAATRTASLSWDNPLILKHMERQGPDSSYTNVPLVQYSPPSRSQVLSEVLRRFVRRSCKCRQDAECVDGHDGAAAFAACSSGCSYISFEFDVVVSKLVWNSSSSRWIIRFRAGKCRRSDTLFLVVYAPWGVDIWKRTLDINNRPRDITITGRAKETIVSTAYHYDMIPKLCKIASHVVTIGWDDDILKELV